MEGKKKIVIGLLGESGSGKDTVAEYLREKHGAKLMRFADPLKEILHIFFDKISREDQQWLALQLRERFGRDIFPKALKRRIENESGIIVVNGIRFWEDYDFIEGFDPGYVIYVTADQKVRWERSSKRGEKSDDGADFKRFQELEQSETEVHIPEIGEKAGFIIRNEKDLNFLLEETDRIMNEIANK
ncbi:MAG: hypothetical protein ACD_15C00003G0007 [uncultured bacterium]|nr:MAG: hypothetical protein ACD_15C00003G0007 [uncultured bacterium]HCU70684.1 hypothetical protein [Candidatus Moranbacteria bacterium]